MITLTREEAQQVLDALEAEHSAIYGTSQTVKATELLRARLAQPEPEPVNDKEMIRRVKALLPELAVKAVEEPIRKKKEWRGLTDEELNEIYNQDGLIYKPLKFYRAIEAKLKEKNT